VALYNVYDYNDVLLQEFWIDQVLHMIVNGNKYVAGPVAPGVSIYYVNTVYDPGGPTTVSWATINVADSTGVSYPDPYGTGFGGCSNFAVSGFYYV